MKKTRTKIIVAILFLAGSVCAFALDIDGKAPTLTGSGANATTQSAVNNAFNSALNELRANTQGIDTKPEDFIRSWGDSAIFASHGATTRAYGDYKLFSFTLGPMIGVQLPGDPFKIADDLDDLTKKLNDDKDIKLGLSPQVFNARLGINTSKFLLDNLYLGLHLGFIKLDGEIFGLEGFDYNNFSLGITGNYQLVKPVKLAAGLILWRGVNVGSGLIYQTTNINYSLKMDSYKAPISGANAELVIDPTLKLDMDIGTVTVPLEATTAVRLLWFLNIPLGVGVDLGFGKSDIKIGMDGDIKIDGLPGTQANGGYVSATAGGDVPPSFFNLKLMTGIGLNFGPVLLDIPVTFYLGNGYNVGVTLGVVW